MTNREYLESILDTRKDSKLINDILKNQDKAELLVSLMPFINHITTCEICHKSGTDRCRWVIKQWTNTCDPDDYDKRRAQKLIDGAGN